MKNKGYFKHLMSWFCFVCFYYKLKEKRTGINYNLDAVHAKSEGGEK